jgi:hypothetical protein
MSASLVSQPRGPEYGDIVEGNCVTYFSELQIGRDNDWQFGERMATPIKWLRL